MSSSAVGIESAHTPVTTARTVIWAAVAVGVGLRIWQYLAGTSLWLDELGVVQNVLSRSIGQLILRPLDWGQVDPKGFLAAEKLAVGLFGPNEFALRLFPLICSIAALILFVRVSEEVLKNAAAIAVVMFAIAAPLIDYAAQTKQYSGDVAVAVLLLLVALRLQRGDRSAHALHIAGAIGAIAVCFSQPAVFVLAGLGAALAATELRKRGRRVALRLWPLLVWWGLSALVAAAVSFVSVPAQTRNDMLAMYIYWRQGTPPDTLLAAIRQLWPLHQLTGLLSPGGQSSLAYPLADFYFILAAGGIGLMFYYCWPTALLVVAPGLVALVAAIARIYPFSDRLILFLLPGIFLGIADAIGWLCLQISKRSSYVGAAGLFILTLPTLLPVAMHPPPYRLDDVKPVLAYLQQHRAARDVVYVYYNAVPAMSFYAGRFGIGPQDYIAGRCYRGDTRSYLSELDRLRGAPRVWILLLGAHTGRKLHDDVLHYLDSRGARTDTFVVRSRSVTGEGLAAELYLYDLSRAGTQAMNSPAGAGIAADPDFISCDIGPIGMSNAADPKALFADH